MEKKAKSAGWIDEWLKSMAKGQASLQEPDWRPLNIWRLEPYFGDFWIEKWLGAIEKIGREKIPLKVLAHSVMPSVWRKEFRFLMYHAKIWGFAKKERLKLIDFFNEMLLHCYKTDPYGLKSNKPHSEEQLDEIFRMHFRKTSPQLTKEVVRLSSSCPALSWSLYTDFYYAGAFEQFGVYDAGKKFGKGAALIVKKFGPYLCTELWPESRRFRYNNVMVYSIYRNVRGYFDIINHFISSENLAEKLTHFIVLADGKEIADSDELHKIQMQIAEYAAEQFENVSNLSFEEQKIYCAEAKWHQFKDFFALLHEGWKPPEEFYERVKGKELLKSPTPKFESKEEAKRFWINLFDPRRELRKEEADCWKNWRGQYE
ncbi:MAG: hypothetical protein V1835_00400 [Candidatus Micrarchaeota archaeon]